MTPKEILTAWFAEIDAHPEFSFDDNAALERLIDKEVEARYNWWFSVKTPPKIGWWLVCTAHGYMRKDYWNGQSWDYVEKAKYWRPLPAPPEKALEAKEK